ncbi:MAG TPA: Ldh family oxidoreductase, partial [Usitatibacter sp.]|nr:Ldh family oxidoreductase [Usitatibacter sp.]
GYGLAMAVDILCGLLNGMTFGPHLNDMYGDLEHPRKLGHFVMAIDPRRFAGGDTMESMVDAMIADLRKEGDVLFSGEPEYIAQEERRVKGIPVEPEALADMNAWSVKLGIPPLTEAANR